MSSDPAANTVSNYGRNCSKSSNALKSKNARFEVNSAANGFRPFGVEEGDIGIGSRWRMLRSLTSGVFCEFLNQNSVQSSPFRAPSTRQIAQFFSEESVCTENIDAWLKLIPHLSSGSVPQTEAHLKSLIWRDWILHSPWHSLSFEARDSEEMMAIHDYSRNTCGIEEQQSVNCEIDRIKKKIKTQSSMSMNLTISAVLLPNVLSSHADVLLQLKGLVALRSRRRTGLTIPSSNSRNDEEVQQVRGIDRDHQRVVFLDGIQLSRQVSDSRERDFYVHMSVKDSSTRHTGRRCSDLDTGACVGMEGEKEEEYGPRENQKEREMGRYKEGEREREMFYGTRSEGPSTEVHVVELITPFYKMLLNTYTYSIYNRNKSNETHRHDVERTLQYVADLPSFLYTPNGLSDRDCYDHDAESSSRSSSSSRSGSNSGSVGADVSDGRSFACFGSISWTVDLPVGSSLVSSFTAEKRYLHREDYPGDASRGLVVPPVMVMLKSDTPQGRWSMSVYMQSV